MIEQPIDAAEKAKEAHARLCNAECMLKVITEYMNEENGQRDGWLITEALEGVVRLLDGCYVELGELFNTNAGDPTSQQV